MNWINNFFEKKKEVIKDAIRTPEEMAYNRLCNLINSLKDISPDVKEISCMGDGFFKIDTNQGLRYIKIHERYKLSFAEGCYSTKDFRGIFLHMNNKIFTVEAVVTLKTVYCPEIEDVFEKSIKIHFPKLCNSAHITEEQIFLCLLEIENIINKYEEKSISKAHAEREAKFIERLAK